MRNEAYKAQMSCFNCGLLSLYDIPVRREIIGYERYFTISHDSSAEEPEQHLVLSCTQRRNGSDKQPLICNRCKMPYLQPAFYVRAIEGPIAVGGSNG